MEDIAVRRIMKDNELYALFFDTPEKLYIVTIDKLGKYGIPYRRIVDEETIIPKKGYTVLETESKRQIFAEYIEDETTIDTLITALF